MIRIQQLTKSFDTAAGRTTVLDRLDFDVDRGEIAAVVGASGAGKSTLARCITLLERPTSGSVIVDDVDLTRATESGLRDARRRIGTVFQSDGLFSRRTAAQNVALPLEYLGVIPSEIHARVDELLDRVGLAGRGGAYPHELSGGQRQRVGVARALALRPRVLLADEATSGLDPESTASILRLLRELRDDLDLSIVLITHEMDVVRRIADTVALLDAGRFAERGRVVDLLQDPASRLGRALQPHRDSERAGDGLRELHLTYASDDVPADWIARAGEELGASIALLGASIEVVDGVTVGRVVVGVPADREAGSLDVLARLGLAASVDDADDAHDDIDIDDADAAVPAEALEPVA